MDHLNELPGADSTHLTKKINKMFVIFYFVVVYLTTLPTA
jgi:hypothetical protein